VGVVTIVFVSVLILCCTGCGEDSCIEGCTVICCTGVGCICTLIGEIIVFSCDELFLSQVLL
jgi:hypothetical protein